MVKLDDYERRTRILARAKKSREAVVVGGGITALELAEGLAARRVKVHYLLRGDRYWGAVLDEAEVAARRGSACARKGSSSTTRARSGDHREGWAVAGVRLADGKTLRCQMLAYAIGIAPRLDLASAAGVAVERGILTDEFLETNIPGIFAAGDVAQVRDPVTGRRVLDSLWNPAREQGLAAGKNMAGAHVPYIKEIPFNVTRLAGLTTTIIGMVGGGRDQDVVGIVRGESESWHERPEAAITAAAARISIACGCWWGSEQILGAIVMGDQGPSRALEGLIRGRVDITPIRERLLEPDAPHWRDPDARSEAALAQGGLDGQARSR